MLMSKLQATCSILDNRNITEETSDKTEARDISKKIIGLTCIKMDITFSTKCNKSAAFSLYKTTMDNSTTQHKARLNFVNWYRHREHAGEMDPTLSLFSGEAWSHFGEYVSSQNNVSNINPLSTIKCYGWCMVCCECN